MPKTFLKYILILFLVAFFSFFGKTQSLDSLYKVLIEGNGDTLKVMTLNTLAKKLEYSDPKKSIDFTNEAILLSEQMGYKKGLARAHVNKGNYYFHKSDYNTALEQYSGALLLSREINDKNGMAGAFTGIGLAYAYKGDYKEAIGNYFDGLRYKEELNDLQGQAVLYNNIGELYMYQNQFFNAIKYHHKSLAIEKKLNNKKGIADSYGNLGSVYHYQKKFHEAHLYYDMAAAQYEVLHDKEGKARSLNNMAIIENDEGDHLKALNDWLASLKIREEIGDKFGIASTCVSIAQIYKANYDYAKALKYAYQAINVGVETDSKRVLRDAYSVLAEIYEKNKDFAIALQYFHKAAALKDTLFNEATTKQIFEMETKYETQKKEKAINSLTKEKRLQELELKTNRWVIYSSIGGLLLLGFLAITIYKRYQLKQKANILITEQKYIVEEKQKEILDSISYAKRLQDAILPAENFWNKTLPQSFVLYKPKDMVAGDFYWLEKFPHDSGYGEGITLFAAADCTGHGVPGALVSVVCSNALNRTLFEFGVIKPGPLLDQTRDLVIKTFAKSDQDVKDGMDISLGAFNNKTNELRWAGANNPLWIIRADQEGEPTITEMMPDKQPIGNYEGQKPFTTHRIQLYKDDLIYVFTDGYADQFGGPKGKKFKYSHMKEVVLANHKLPMDQQKEELDRIFNEWKGNLEQVDDVCVIGFRI